MGSSNFQLIRGIRVKVQPTEHTGTAPLAAGAIFWLGLMHGHWDVPEDQIGIVATGNRRDDQINAGVAIVVPCHKVLELLEQAAIQSDAAAAFDRIYVEEDTLFFANKSR